MSSSYRIEFPDNLPISPRAPEIIDLLAQHQTLILAGETGSGKTTQIPKICLAAGRTRIACTQPRRIAALSISQRVADELNTPWGQLVGCKIRFSDNTSPDTQIKFLTDGMLLAELHSDPRLLAYDTIILDEAHERSLNIDFLIGHLRNLRFQRPDLKIIITSATIDTAAFSAAFDDAPVIQVSGRTYPVETLFEPEETSDNAPDTGSSTEHPLAARCFDGNTSDYTESAANAATHLIRHTHTGDILIFMPAERDILETIELLEGRKLPRTEIIPLFSQLSNSAQKRVFASSQKRKIIVATNIAETSITIPGIHYVIDTGLARISRYSPQLRTRRLPIEPISQSSADQRKGRAGRIAHGTCIRLYTQSDFDARPRYTQPEIQRANLADVILRMKAIGLGAIERFPFINPPPTTAIRAGYSLLAELNALETNPNTGSSTADSQLTAIGRELSLLPLDPTIGRMLIQARHERALHEVLIIASALSIQDPRERPHDNREKAAAAHKKFNHPDSDFLTLLNIWNTYHDQLEQLSQNKLRQFCSQNFLSYARIREWRDIHRQLLQLLQQQPRYALTSIHDGISSEKADADQILFPGPGYRAIHRSILAGLLTNIATYDEQNQNYKSTHDRRLTLFPASTLHSNSSKTKKHNGNSSAPDTGNSTKQKKSARWIMCAEVIETTRLFARTNARIDPSWLFDLGEHLLKTTHTEPAYDPENHRVTVKRRTRIHGLEIDSRRVSYVPINPVHATEIFIREALVNDTLDTPALPFLEHNRETIAHTRNRLAHTRDSSAFNLDETLYRFYSQHLPPPIASLNDLQKFYNDLPNQQRQHLHLTPTQLLPDDTPSLDPKNFPPSLPLDNNVLPLNYAYKPGTDEDGATLDIPLSSLIPTNVSDKGRAVSPKPPFEASPLSISPEPHKHSPGAAAPYSLVTSRYSLLDGGIAAAIDFAIPGHLPEKIQHLLRALPKDLRRTLPTINQFSEQLTPLALQHHQQHPDQNLHQTLSFLLQQNHQITVPASHWKNLPYPPHLTLRLRLVDEANNTLHTTRDPATLPDAIAQTQQSAAASTTGSSTWRAAAQRYEKPDQSTYTFGTLPEKIQVTTQAGIPIYAYPALKPSPNGASLILHPNPDTARELTAAGISSLLSHQLRHDLAHLENNLRTQLRPLAHLFATLTTLDTLTANSLAHIKNTTLTPTLPPQLSEKSYQHLFQETRIQLRTTLPDYLALLKEILTLRQAVLVHPTPTKDSPDHLRHLFPQNFPATLPHDTLQHYPRYLRALDYRCTRWQKNAAKDAQTQKTILPFLAHLKTLPTNSPDHRQLFHLIEELRVSLHAQPLGTSTPISPQKLTQYLHQQKPQQTPPTTGTSTTQKAPATPPPAPPPTQQKPLLATQKSKPLKNLSSLDSLFHR